MGEYTRNLEDDLFFEVDCGGYDEEFDYSVLLELINSRSFFAPFSDRLRRFIGQITDHEAITADEALAYLRQQFKQIPGGPSINTLKNWFKENNPGPKNGADGRTAMYQVAFALGLNAEQTKDLFRKVFLDTAFTIRNPDEFIFLYCIRNGKTYEDALQMIAEYAHRSPSEKTDITSGTIYIRSVVETSASSAALISYMEEHQQNFTSGNQTALALQEGLLNELAKGINGKPGLAAQEYFKSNDRSEGRSTSSVDFLLDMILHGPNLMGKNDIDALAPIKHIFQLKEITNQFPDADSIAKSGSTYILRKNLILLYFYKYWISDQLNSNKVIHGDYESFSAELNNLLYTCGLSPLYPGNPYDWIFLFCSAYSKNEVSPLDVFRELFTSDNEENQ